jgi:hypothetical protein
MGSRGRQIALGAVALALAAAAVMLWPRTSATPASSSNPEGGRGSRAEGDSVAHGVPDVHLSALDRERPAPAAGDRNLFSFRVRPPAPVSAPPSRVARPVPPAAGGPAPAPPLAPIALKFIGVLELPEQNGKVAVLSDGRGAAPIYGKEGETVLGQYRILRIGAESIEMSYLDGRGRQTIRLTGG